MRDPLQSLLPATVPMAHLRGLLLAQLSECDSQPAVDTSHNKGTNLLGVKPWRLGSFLQHRPALPD